MHTDPRGPPKYPYPASACASADDIIGPADARDVDPSDLLAINGVEGF